MNTISKTIWQNWAKREVSCGENPKDFFYYGTIISITLTAILVLSWAIYHYLIK